MIKYERGCINIFSKVLQCRGSVFPMSFAIATPCACVTAILRLVMDMGYLRELVESDGVRILRDNSVWSSFTFLIGFLVVFRTSQAYARFWDGCTSTHQMRAEWYDACSSLFAFCKDSCQSLEETLKFQHLIVRLFSMLHAVALADIEDSNKDRVQDVAAFRYELVDGVGLDVDSLRALKRSDAKVELIFQWIQQVIVENIGNGVLSIPAPILSRSFQEIANGMVAFHDAIKISTIPFPFPYAQICELLLLMHWVVSPIVISQYVSTPWWGAVFTFLQVFVYWSLNAIAIEIENPFGMDANDIDAAGMQEEMNRHLLLLLEPATKQTPTLNKQITSRIVALGEFEEKTFRGRASLLEIWEEIDAGTAGENAYPVRRRNLASQLSGSSSARPSGGQREATSSFSLRRTPRPAQPAVAEVIVDRIDSNYEEEQFEEELDLDGVAAEIEAFEHHVVGGNGIALGAAEDEASADRPHHRPNMTCRLPPSHSNDHEGLGADEAPPPDDYDDELPVTEWNPPAQTAAPRMWTANAGSSDLRWLEAIRI